MLCTMCRRWERVQGASSNGDAWVGGLLPGVVVDDWGEFNFILVRVRALGGRQRMLVRGGNYASRAQLVEALTRQVGPRRGWRVARRGGLQYTETGKGRRAAAIGYGWPGIPLMAPTIGRGLTAPLLCRCPRPHLCPS